MKYSVGVEYALHSLFYMINMKENQTIGIKSLANLHNISETYLSKIFTKLNKSNILNSVPGVKGGYRLDKVQKIYHFGI